MTVPADVRDVFKKATCLQTKADVESALDTMATAISYELADANPLLLCVVVGGIVALGNLLPRLDFPLEVDYVHATRYGMGCTGKEVKWLAKPSYDLKGRTIILVDDILDGGITLQSIVEYCKEQGAEKVYSAVLVDKQDARLEGGLPEADFAGLTVPNEWLFGYGLDYKGYLRNAPGIYSVADEHID